jgi:hypothetical protein
MTLPRRACELPSSSREPTYDCCAQNSRRSCPLVHRETPLFGPHLIVSRLRLTAAARRKNSSPENLTQLHYNLLGKDSRVRSAGSLKPSSRHHSVTAPEVRYRYRHKANSICGIRPILKISRLHRQVRRKPDRSLIPSGIRMPRPPI